MPRKSLLDVTADAIDRSLRPEGFIRQKHAWYLKNDRGDFAVVELQKSPRLPGMEPFYVNTAIVPLPWWSWMRALVPNTRTEAEFPTAADGVLDSRVDAPGGGPVGLGWTVSDPRSADSVGDQVATLLKAGPIAELRRLLDRQTLLAELQQRGPVSPAVRAALLADDGPSAELEAALRECRETWPDNTKFFAWIHEYRAGKHA